MSVARGSHLIQELASAGSLFSVRKSFSMFGPSMHVGSRIKPNIKVSVELTNGLSMRRNGVALPSTTKFERYSQQFEANLGLVLLNTN